MNSEKISLINSVNNVVMIFIPNQKYYHAVVVK